MPVLFLLIAGCTNPAATLTRGDKEASEALLAIFSPQQPDGHQTQPNTQPDGTKPKLKLSLFMGRLAMFIDWFDNFDSRPNDQCRWADIV